MEVKLERPVDGKFGTYPADTWLEAQEIEGFIFVSIKGHPNMKLKRIARSNIKETRNGTDRTNRGAEGEQSDQA